MRIILNEIKKIFSLKMIVLLILITVTMFFVFDIVFHIKYFPNGRPALDIYNIGVEMVENYGEYMDEDEFEHFKSRYDELVKEADEYIQSRDDFIELGITTYEEFENKDRDNEELDKLNSKVLFEEEVDLFWELPMRKYYMGIYEKKEELMRTKDWTEKQKERVEELISKGSETSTLPEVVFQNYNDIVKPSLALILISIIFMLSPIYIRDNLNGMNYLQYSSKAGRRLFKRKIAAGLLSAFIITTIQLAAFFALYSLNNVSMFYDCNINSVFNALISWYDITFRQYIALTVMGIYILSFVTALISMFISSIGKSYIAVIGMLLPLTLFLIIVLLGNLIIDMTAIWKSELFLPISYLALTLIGIVIMSIRWKKERVLDIV